MRQENRRNPDGKCVVESTFRELFDEAINDYLDGCVIQCTGHTHDVDIGDISTEGQAFVENSSYYGPGLSTDPTASSFVRVNNYDTNCVEHNTSHRYDVFQHINADSTSTWVYVPVSRICHLSGSIAGWHSCPPGTTANVGTTIRSAYLFKTERTQVLQTGNYCDYGGCSSVVDVENSTENQCRSNNENHSVYYINNSSDSFITAWNNTTLGVDRFRLRGDDLYDHSHTVDLAGGSTEVASANCTLVCNGKLLRNIRVMQQTMIEQKRIHSAMMKEQMEQLMQF